MSYLAQAFGIVSFVLSIVAIFIPVFGVFIAGMSGVLAWLSIGRLAVLGVAAVIINILNILIFSPTFLLLIALESSKRTPDQLTTLKIWLVVLVIQFVYIILFLLNIIIITILRRTKKKERIVSRSQKELSATNQSSSLSSTPTDSPHLTKVLVTKIHGGRKEHNDVWLDLGGTAASLEKTKRKKPGSTFSPILLSSLLLIIGLTVIGTYYFSAGKHLYKPLNRVYETGVPNTAPPQIISPTTASSPPVKKNKGTIPPQRTQQKVSNIKGTVYSWTDSEGNTHYSNVSAPQGNPTVQKHTEFNSYNRRTPVKIVGGNKVFVPMTLGHAGKQIEIEILLDTGCTTTTIPSRITEYLKADFIRDTRSTVADGRKVPGKYKKVDFINVGPHTIGNFKIISQRVAGSDNKGLLGMDFLKKHPFTIDHQNELIIWQ